MRRRTTILAAIIPTVLAGASLLGAEAIDSQIAAHAAALGVNRLAVDREDDKGVLLIRLALTLEPENETAWAALRRLALDHKIAAVKANLTEARLVDVFTTRATYLQDMAAPDDRFAGRRSLLYYRAAAEFRPDDEDVAEGIQKHQAQDNDWSLTQLMDRRSYIHNFIPFKRQRGRPKGVTRRPGYRHQYQKSGDLDGVPFAEIDVIVGVNDVVQLYLGGRLSYGRRAAWTDIPADLPLKRFGVPRAAPKAMTDIRIRKKGCVFVGIDLDLPEGNARESLKRDGWRETKYTLGYQDEERRGKVQILTKVVDAGLLTLPRLNASGPFLILP